MSDRPTNQEPRPQAAAQLYSNEPPPPTVTAAATAAASQGGCLPTGALVLLALWVLLATTVAQTLTWALEQQIFEGSLPIPDLRWAVTLGYALAVILPALVIWGLGRDFPNRRVFLAFGLAGGLVLLLVPARLAGITNALATNLLQIAGAGIFWLALRFLRRRLFRRQRPRSTWDGLGAALLVAGLLSIPWVLWGALGSAWDIVLNLIAALVFGLAAAEVLDLLFSPTQSDPQHQNRFLDGVQAGLLLLVMTTGLGVNGNQGLLAEAVPFLGLALIGLYLAERREDGGVPGAWLSNRRVLALLIGLAAFWPMAFIDPDEMATIVSLGQGELIQWANQAAALGLVLGLGAGLLLLTRPGLARAGRRSLVGILAGLAWLAAAALYVGLGQPGLFGERLFVILKEQADLSTAAQIPDYNQRRTFVYQKLVQQADSNQAGLRQALDNLRIPYKPYYLENAIEIEAGPLVRWWLLTRPEVDRVLADPMLRPLPAPIPPDRGFETSPVDTPWNLKMIGADRVWNELGVTGQGVVVGQSDSGAQGDHPELSGNYRGQGGKNDGNWYDPWYHSTAPTDIGGHGTHTLGTAVGKSVGVAPGATWIGCVNLGRNLGNPAFYLDCMQFNLAPFPQQGNPLRDGRPEQGAMVLNNSWGCPPVEGCDPNALLPAVQALRAAGVFVVASAGNEGEGGCASVSDPIALYDQVYSVGAVTESGRLASFSSTGPVEVDGSGRIKPDIVAPGQGVLSSVPGSSYASNSGTSMAGPHVVGVVALMWSANPALIGDIDRTQEILDETALPYQGPLPECVAPGKPNNAVGYGIVNAYEAVKRAQGK